VHTLRSYDGTWSEQLVRTSKYALVPRAKRWYARIISSGWFIAESVPFRVGTVGLLGSEDRTISRYPFQGNTCATRLAAITVITLPRALARDAFRADPSLCGLPSDGWLSVEYPFLSIEDSWQVLPLALGESSATRAFGFPRSFTLSFRAIVSIDSTMRDAHVCASRRALNFRSVSVCLEPYIQFSYNCTQSIRKYPRGKLITNIRATNKLVW